MVRKVDVLAADLPIGQVVFELLAGRHRVYPVVDSLGRPMGLVSRADALRWKVKGGHDRELLGERVSDTALPVVHPGDVAARAVDLMLATDQGRIPVVDPVTGVLVGLITRKDLLQVRASVVRAEGERQAYYPASARAAS